MKAEDKDFGANGSVFYRFAMPVKGFSINSLTGEIQATEPLGGMTQAQRTLIVEAMDQGSPAQSAQGVVVIYLKELEYNGIRFSRNARDVSIQENAAKGLTLLVGFEIILVNFSLPCTLKTPLCLVSAFFFSSLFKNSGTAVAQAQAQHPDGTHKGISYSLFSGNRKQGFTINTSTGETKSFLKKSEWQVDVDLKKNETSSPICVPQVKSGCRALMGWTLKTPPDSV